MVHHVHPGPWPHPPGPQDHPNRSARYRSDPNRLPLAGVPEPPAGPLGPVGVPSWFDFSGTSYLKGFLIGAAVTVAVTHPAVRGMLVRGGVRLWTTLQGGLEEIKEQVQDVKAEMGRK